jgi:hypothetical protein
MSVMKLKLLYDWQSVSQSVRLGIEHPRGTCDQTLLPVAMLLSEICGLVSVGRPLWREDAFAICSVITQLSDSRRTLTILYCLIWDSSNLEGQVPVFISPRNRWPSYTPRHCVFYLELNSTLYLTGNTLRLHYEPNRSMLSIGSWRWYINITITILDIMHRPVFYLKHDVSETGFCLRLQVEPTQLCAIAKASLCLLITEG